VTDELNKNGITKEEEEILLDLYSRNSHFMTPGARRAFNQIKLGYIILAIGFIVGIWGLTHRTDHNLRRDINNVARLNCIGGIKTINKYNDFINGQIEILQASYHLNIKKGEKERANLNLKAIERYQKDKIIPPTPAQCKIPILK
jgi:hypothetical protein